MRKIICILAVLTLILSMAACAKEAPAEVTVLPSTVPPETTEETTEATTEETTEETTEPAPTEPETVSAMAKVAYGELRFGTLERGSTVTVIGTFGDYCVIEGKDADLLIEQRFLRAESEEPYTSWTGYAAWDTKVYENAYMEGEPFASLAANEPVTVTESGDGWACITWGETKGYCDPDKLSTHPITGGGGGGAGDGSDVPMGSLSHRGGISQLGAYAGPEFEAAEPFTATVLIDDARTYLSLTLRGGELRLLTVGEEVCTVWLGGFEATVSRSLVQLAEDPLYEQRTVFCRYGAELCGEYQLRNVLKTPATNTELLVLDEVPGCLIVELEGEIFYVDPALVSDTRITGGGNGGGGGGGWTPPAM